VNRLIKYPYSTVCRNCHVEEVRESDGGMLLSYIGRAKGPSARCDNSDGKDIAMLSVLQDLSQYAETLMGVFANSVKSNIKIFLKLTPCSLVNSFIDRTVTYQSTRHNVPQNSNLIVISISILTRKKCYSIFTKMSLILPLNPALNKRNSHTTCGF